MKKIVFFSLGLFLFIILLSSGCMSQNSSPNQVTMTTKSPTLSQNYVTEVTPFITSTQTPERHPTIPAVTQPPENKVCLIYQKDLIFTNIDKTAISFNLINPPMYVNYTIDDTKKGPDGKYASYYTVTIRDKNTGTIYGRVGAGKDDQNGGYFNFPIGSSIPSGMNIEFGGTTTLKVMESGNLLIEFEGKDITLHPAIWVKPSGNLDSSYDINSAKCINFPDRGYTKL
jgi:hypothetical protein